MSQRQTFILKVVSNDPVSEDALSVIRLKHVRTGDEKIFQTLHDLMRFLDAVQHTSNDEGNDKSPANFFQSPS
jgi:hypothetical protein